MSASSKTAFYIMLSDAMITLEQVSTNGNDLTQSMQSKQKSLKRWWSYLHLHGNLTNIGFVWIATKLLHMIATPLMAP